MSSTPPAPVTPLWRRWGRPWRHSLSLPVAVRLANLAAGISVGKVGASVVREADLLAALTPQHSALRKIVTREEAVEQAERWRHRGWRVGFHQRLLRPAAPGPHPVAGAGSGGLRPADRRLERRYQRAPAEGRAASGAAGGRAGRGAGQLRLCRPGLPVRGRYARSADRGAAAGCADQGRQSCRRGRGRRRPGARLGRPGDADRPAGGPTAAAGMAALRG